MLCIACNSKVHTSIKICSCGHVCSPTSQRILGKRFSAYRVRRRSSGLRERQSNESNKTDTATLKKKKTIVIRTGQPTKKSKDMKDLPIKRIENFKKKTSKKQPRLQVHKENYSSKYKMLMRTSPQKTLRLSLALAEINRRICGQSLLWRMLST